MRRRILKAALLVAFWAPVVGAQTEPPFTLRGLTNMAAELELAIRREQNPADRKRLADELEKVRHQMGPFDFSGNRVHPRVMWHDTAIESLAVEAERLVSRADSPSPASLVFEARAHTRRMAAACLMHGWRILEEGPKKYRADAFGQYLANNLGTLDALFEALGAWLVKETKLERADEARQTFKEALGKAKEGVAAMGRAAEAVEQNARIDQEPFVAALDRFLEGLRAVRDADAALRARQTRQADGAGETQGAVPAGPSAEPPPMTADEKKRIARVKAVAARLKDEAWDEVRPYLAKFAAVIERGFQVPSARPKVREFLNQIERAAAMVQSLQSGKAVYAMTYRDGRAKALVRALRLMESPLERARGYSRLRSEWNYDRLRRQLESGSLSAAASRGLACAYYEVVPELSKGPTEVTIRRGAELRSSVLTIAGIQEKMVDWPPKDMAGALKQCYARQAALFTGATEEAGRFFPASQGMGIPQVFSAADRARDLERLIRADRVVKAVAKYMPACAKAMYGQLSAAARKLVDSSTRPQPARRELDRLILPFEDLARFQAPEPRHMRAVTGLVGRTYNVARSVLDRQIAEGIEAASEGNPTPLRRALEAQHLFGLMRRRAVAETYRLDKAGVTNLTTFSVPGTPWEKFLSALGRNLRSTLAAYAKGRPLPRERLAAPGHWDEVYRSVAAGQRCSVDARTEGESELDFLLRNLERVAVPSPHWTTWHGWAVGYHVGEAAVSINAGAAAAGEWHRSQVRAYDGHLRRTELEPRPDRRTGRQMPRVN